MSLFPICSSELSGIQRNPDRVTTVSPVGEAVRSCNPVSLFLTALVRFLAALSAASNISMGRVLLVASILSSNKKVIRVA